MLIIPAIDLKKDKIVRLYKGRFDKISHYEQEVTSLVREYIMASIKRLHVVLLLGAQEGNFSEKENSKIKEIIKVRNTYGRENCRIQMGGGIRRLSQMKYFFDAGIDYMIMGTSLLIPQAIEEGLSMRDIKYYYQQGGKKFVQEEEIPEIELIDFIDHEMKEKIIVAIDYIKDEVALSGWEVSIPFLPEYMIKKLTERGYKRFIITNIDRDGTLEGIDPESITRILNKIKYFPQKPSEIIIAGGVSSEQDIENLCLLDYPPDGVVIGKALYQGNLDLGKVIKRFQI
jgi:phosphoribosylformimino-5-aminoimidazole carboxamide ribotide isomerase